MKMTVLGTGYLGATTHAASTAEMGFEVLGLVVDPAKVAALSRGELPFHEPGLGEPLRKHVGSGRLRVTTSYEEAGIFGHVHLVGVGTPQRPGGFAADMRSVDAAVESIAATTKDYVVAGESTIRIGFAWRLADLAKAPSRESVNVDLVWNPELLREGYAVEDTLSPNRLVLGEHGDSGEAIMREVYPHHLGAGVPLVVTDYEIDELVKVETDGFLATKSFFVHALSELMKVVGGDIRTLADGTELDERIGRNLFNAGAGLSGGCLPKDIRALRAGTTELTVEESVRLLAEVDDVNVHRRETTVLTITTMLGGPVAGKHVAVLGAAFKPDSDDVHHPPARDIAARLHSSGTEVAVYDPKVNANATERYPHLNYVDSLEAAVTGAQIVVLLTEWAKFEALPPRSLSRSWPPPSSSRGATCCARRVRTPPTSRIGRWASGPSLPSPSPCLRPSSGNGLEFLPQLLSSASRQ